MSMSLLKKIIDRSCSESDLNIYTVSILGFKCLKIALNKKVHTKKRLSHHNL